MNRFSVGPSKAVFSLLSVQSRKCQLIPCSNRAKNSPTPTISFGIIAALTKDNVIGINGALPWKHLPQDKAHFINVTSGKVLVIGRKSFVEEDPMGENVRHARACVILSRKMGHDDLFALKHRRAKGPDLRLARCFEEALCVAQELSICENDDADFDSSISVGEVGIDCWIAGGEDIYREALQHDNLRRVSLTFVDMKIDANVHQFKMNNRVTFFPLEDFYQIGFEEVSRSVDGRCTFCAFERIKGRPETLTVT